MSQHRQKNTRSRRPQHKVRIIAGEWRGRLLDFPDVDGLRPTGDRMRETLFNWLNPWLVGSRCADLFAGSGALGFEAASRGADAVYMLDINAQAVAFMQQNKQRLKASQVSVLQQCAITFLQQSQVAPFDVVFIDPPFSLGLWQSCIDALRTHNQLRTNALIYIETPIGTVLNTPVDWLLRKEKNAGNNCFQLWQRIETTP